jgi:hypothetical protein
VSAVRTVVLALAVLGTACAPGTRASSTLAQPFKPVTLAELAANPRLHLGEQVVFQATIERVEETAQGIWMFLAEDGQKLAVYVPMSFGGAFREQVQNERMQFEVRVGETRLTSLGVAALEVLPFQISKTTYFEQPVPLDEAP